MESGDPGDGSVGENVQGSVHGAEDSRISVNIKCYITFRVIDNEF